MRIPRPLDEAGYERELRALVYHFEREMRRPRHLKPNTQLGRLYQAFVDAGVPLTAAEAAIKAGLDILPNVLGPTRQHLEQLGWIERCGTKEQIWWTPVSGLQRHHVLLFRATVVPERGLRNDSGIVTRFLHRVEVLEQRRATNLCLAQRIESTVLTSLKNPHRKVAGLEQKREIIERRLRGEEFQAIANDYGITRERVRQIVQAAAFPKPHKPKKLRSGKLSLWTRGSRKRFKLAQPASFIGKGFGQGRSRPMSPLWDWWLLDGTTI